MVYIGGKYTKVRTRDNEKSDIFRILIVNQQ